MAINKSIILLAAFLIITLNMEAQSRLVNYLPDTLTNFPNPERGMAPVIDPPWPTTITWKLKGCEGYTWTAWTDPLNRDTLKFWRQQGHSVVIIRYHIAEFRNSNLSKSFIERLNSDFAVARETGMKLIPRFTYNWPRGGPDAPLDIVLTHIGQLKPVFKKNVDVITFVDLGFIGCWGEQHHSCNGLVDGMLTPNSKSWLIVDSLFAAVPPERMIALRYPFWKFRYFGSINDEPVPPTTESEAYTGTKKARWAHHDDCLVCGEWNMGTWNTSRNNAQEIIDFLGNDNHFVFQGGESGDPGNSSSKTDQDKDGYVYPNYTSCERMRWLLEKEHWSILSANYGENFNNRANTAWRNGGCYSEMMRRLGYRFRLVNATIPSRASVKKMFNMSFTIHNDGWASPHNPRVLEVILRNSKTGLITKLPVTDGLSIPENHNNDPRFWLSGNDYIIKVVAKLPENITRGVYEVLLNLPDPMLYDRHEYSIRLANMDIWEERTGYNSFLHSLTIK